MEQNKLEKNIKEKLNERMITPSDNLWDKLEFQLDQNQNKKAFNLSYFVAGLLLFLGLGYVFFAYQSSVTNVKAIDVVNTNTEKEFLTNNDTTTVLADKSKQYIEKQEKASRLIKSVTQVQYANNESVLKSSSAVDTIILTTNKTDIAKIQSKKEITIAENKIVINAQSLLNEVESQINTEYRENTIAKINRNYKVIKTAIVNRNYE